MSKSHNTKQFNKAKHASQVHNARKSGPSFIGADYLITEESRRISTRVVEQINKVTIGYGKIEKVLPMTNKIYVSVRVIPNPTEENNVGDFLFDPPLYNSLGMNEEDLSIWQVMIPLLNIDTEVMSVSLGGLVGKFVSVSIDSSGLAKDATLLAALPNDDYLLEKPLDLLLKSTVTDIKREDLFKLAGYDVEKTSKLFDQKISDTEGNVLRIKGEAYWDRDTGELKEDDGLLKESPDESWLNKALKKKQKCHYPIVMFGAK